ncbi:MAG: Omp28-related outer membrane protein [Prevotellaceae bacterium]|nr:Omp28-related outer membrane protein [Prevotellaceae bacterium]
MKKFLFISLAALCLVLAGCKHEPVYDDNCHLKVSWSDGVTDYLEIGTTISAANQFPDTMLVGKGNQIVGVRVAFETYGTVRSAEIFITNDLEGNALYTQTFEPKGYGLEYVKLNTPFPVKKNGDKLYVGYKVKTSSSGSGYLGYYQGKKQNQMANYVFYGDKWRNLTDILNTTDYPITKKFYSVVEVYINGGDYSKYPQYDLQIHDVDCGRFLQVGADNRIKGLITNSGVRTATDGFTITYKDNNNQNQTITVEEQLENGQTAEFEFPNMTPSEAKEIEFTLTAQPVNASNSTSNNVAVDKQVFYGNYIFPRTLLFEEFTEQSCVWCPFGAAGLHESIEGNEDKVAVLCHHTGYQGSDNLTITESNINNGVGWLDHAGAPMSTLDRRIIAGWTGSTEVVFNPMGATKNLINKQLAIPAIVKVDLNTTYNEASRELTVDVSGEFAVDLPNARLNVWLVQDSIIAPQSSPATSAGVIITWEQYKTGNYSVQRAVTKQDYVHNHVPRYSFTGAWGAEISNSVGTFSKQYTYVIPESIKGIKKTAFDCVPKNMYIVAFVADYVDTNDRRNILYSEVRNAAFKYIME